MGDRTEISWTDATWNPTVGCDRVSPGCDHCYALTMAARLKRMGQAKYQADGDPRTSGPGFALTLHPDTLDVPLRWRKPRKVFVNSMSDLFHKDVPTAFIEQVWDTMALASRHQFQVLTKRPQRMREWASGYVVNPLPNVWLGTSIESDRYTFRADHLRATPAAVRFLSLEPLLGPLPSLDLTGIDWVIVGGESGPGARPMHPDWARNIRDRCVAAGVPFLFKQWGAWGVAGDGWSLYDPNEVGQLIARKRTGPCTVQRCSDLAAADSVAAVLDTNHHERLERVGKHKAGRELDGRTWDEYPAEAS